MYFHPGGDLATQLARWGRLGRDRARFYAAEIVKGVEGLHKNGVIYRDLKPENVLIGSDGHIVLTDFGLSKEFPRRSSTITAPSTPNGTRGEFFANGVPQSPSLDKGSGSEILDETCQIFDPVQTFCKLQNGYGA
jgi:serum/glucocorticoid-regulated kinase 2